ncbi:MAG: FAD-binding protein, partial [Dehalococcoidia bacterium]|nr:FAD-binding protein [Dehalococcoidia bacterium]
MADGPSIRDSGQRSWTNKHVTFTVAVQGLYDAWNGESGDSLARYQATTAAIGAFIDASVKDGAPLRALGSGWSFSHAAVTDGRLVNTKPLNLFFSLDPALVAPAYPGDRDGLRFVQCGNSVSALNRALKAQQRSLRTTGASNGQTIVGVSATGSHGSAIDIGPVADFIVALHVVLGAGRHVWLERASYPVVTDAFIAKLGAEPLRDDAVFNAALVGLGSFGFIHGAVIETDPIFLLEMHRHLMP